MQVNGVLRGHVDHPRRGMRWAEASRYGGVANSFRWKAWQGAVNLPAAKRQRPQRPRLCRAPDRQRRLGLPRTVSTVRVGASASAYSITTGSSYSSGHWVAGRAERGVQEPPSWGWFDGDDGKRGPDMSDGTAASTAGVSDLNPALRTSPHSNRRVVLWSPVCSPGRNGAPKGDERAAV